MSTPHSPRNEPDPPHHSPYKSPIEVELISDDEMAMLEAALSAAARSFSLPHPAGVFLRTDVVRSVTLASGLPARRRLGRGKANNDIEDCVRSFRSRRKVGEGGTGERGSFLERFRRNRGLSVTDLTATEWCEKQMEFCLDSKKKISTKAMKAGRVRHEKLEQEVVTRVKVHVQSKEDKWALRFINFVVGANQLLFEGLTRELPLICLVEGVWMVGVIDEIRMPVVTSNDGRNPILVDTKTREKNTLPSEPQRRNGRLQLMCYKIMWDTSVGNSFPYGKFFDYFHLDRFSNLSEEIIQSAANAGVPAKNLDEIVRSYCSVWEMLPLTHDNLLLRYESQKDHSLLGEDWFPYNHDWLKGRIQKTLEFWNGEREADYAPEKERWKCRFCPFTKSCSPAATTEGASSSADSYGPLFF
ncbi:hypothetical protein MLD38_011644 [Melastoma candidum]|uniref:Uncharacterized protein n=1 Tax=Melastoma candidum TaxID=119954 RepID=A0ACB9R3Q8_9MYRT|nr:hypothetical protein MLD38_011644 [Melastoma candidum]